MAFWGVEVKPGRPYVHHHDPSHGRLRICQATLGNFNVTTRSMIQCNVGKERPVTICILNPKMIEMCHLEVEFEEDEDVVLSVLGQSSIHLTGYFIRARNGGEGDNVESETVGEDIGEHDTDEEYRASQDRYESDFIDDDSATMSSSPIERKRDVLNKSAAKVARRRHLRKKHQASDSDEENEVSSWKPTIQRKFPSIFDSVSEDGDDLPFAVALSTKKTVKTEGTSMLLKPRDKARKRKRDVIQGLSSESEKPLPCDKKSNTLEIDHDHQIIQKSNAPLIATQEEDSPQIERPVNARDQICKISDENDYLAPVTEHDFKIQTEGVLNCEKAEERVFNKIQTLDNGLMIVDMIVGDANAKMASNGCKVSVNYLCRMLNGEVIESSVNKRPHKFRLGAGRVISGWDVGICGMRVGGKRRLTIPPSMGYGDKAEGKAPPNSWLIYEVELVKVR